MTNSSALRFVATLALCAVWSAFVALSATAAGPYPVNMCVGTRNGNLGCSANDVAIAQVRVTNGVTSCVAGTTVDVGLEVDLQSNANARYDIGVFVAKDGKPPELDTASGGSADCAVFGVPTGPAPLADLNSNACGDLQKSSSLATVSLGTVSVLCVPDQNGKLKLPATVTWEQNANGTCSAPPAAWVEASTPAKCNAADSLGVPVQVVGSLVIVKQTLPAATAGSFAFTASGATPATFSLAHGQRRELTTGALTSAPTTVTVTEALLAGFDPTADIACTTADGGPASFVAIDKANRRITASLTAANSRATCTFTNKAESRIRIVKAAKGGDGTFAFVAGQQEFTITTSAGSGERVYAGLPAGTYEVTELVPAGWKLTDIACSDPSGGTTVSVAGKKASIGLAAGETVTCTFTNERSAPPATGVINVVKTAAGGNGSFPFTAQVGSTQSFTLATSGGTSPTKSFTGLAAGTYTVTELVPAGWTLSSITCADPTNNSSGAGATATINLAAGETVTCTFENRKNASVVIQKFTEGGDGTFSFTGTASFSITTQGGFGEDTTTFASVTPGESFSYNETVPAGWQFNGTTCRDTVTGATVGTPAPNGRAFVPAAGQQVLCTVNNGRLAQLTIVEVSTPKAGQAFAYTATGTGLANFSLTDDGSGNNKRVFANLAPGGSYSVAQAAVAGWTTTAIQCSDRNASDPASRTAVDLASRTVTPNLQPGESLTCTYYNQQAAAGAITVVKSATGGDAPFAFANSGGTAGSATNPASFTITTASGSGSQQLSSLAAGTYTITETVPAGWLSPPAVQCAVASGSNTTFTPVAGGMRVSLGTTGGAVDSARCTFENTKAARITIVEDAQPDATQAFAYAATGTGVPANFTLVNDGAAAPAERRSFEGLGAGAYRFTVTNPAGWTLTAIKCAGGKTTVSVPSGQASVTLEAGDDVTCTFRHSREGSLTITKSADQAAAGDRFTFTGPAGLAGDYAAGQSRTAALAPGSYAVTELVPAGWDLTNIACTGGQWSFTGAPGGSFHFEPGDTTANVTIAAGEAVACTFTNTKITGGVTGNGTLDIVKTTAGGDGSFPFTAQVGSAQSFTLTTGGGISQTRSYTGLGAGTYTVTELVPPGWTLASITCVDPTNNSSGVGATATVNLAKDETVRCTFANVRAASVVVEKSAVGGDATFAFGGTAAFSITTSSGSGRDATTFASVAAGAAVTITETAPEGWVLGSAACRDAATNGSVGTALPGGVRVTPTAGQQIVCTFTNTKLAQLTIAEVSSPKAAQVFAYTTTGAGLADFPLHDDGTNTGNTRTFTNLVPGQAYAVTQGAAAGWTTPHILCSDRLATDPASRTAVDLASRRVTPNLQPGERLLCVFVNAQVAAGTINVAKVASGGDGTFAFTNTGGAAGSATNPAAFGITTAAGSGARSLSGLASGSYTITESVPPGWLGPPTVQCSVVSGSSTTITPVANGVTINLGQTGLAVDSVACTFENTLGARITIVEDAIPDAAQAFTYAATGPGVPASFSLTNDGAAAPAERRAFEGLGAGAYRFTVTNPAGWRLLSVGCTGNDGSTTSLPAGQANVTVAPGEDVTCTFRHAREATITITKSANGGAAGDLFAFTGPAGLAGDYAAGQTRSAVVLPGIHAVAEIVPAGWTLANIACTGGAVQYTGATAGATDAFEAGDNTANIRIAAGEAVACTFTNAPAGSTIVVRKESVGGAGIFAFTGVEDFQIDTRNRMVPEYQIAVPAGTHVVQEIVPAGWRLTGLTCTGTSTVDPATARATVTIAAGQRVRCTFTNEKLGRIEIIKAIRGEKTGEFSFTVPPTLDAAQRIVLTPAVAVGSATRVFENVPRGTYVVTEDTPPAGFGLFTLDCADPTANSATSVSARTATIDVAPGETVSCTYLNVTTATIVVGAVSFQGQGRFGFTAESAPGKEVLTFTIDTEPFNANAGLGTRSRSDLLPVVYTITALPAPAGWTFSRAQCVSNSGEQHWTITGSTAVITLPDGETVRCYYFYVPAAGPGGGEPTPIPVLSLPIHLLFGFLLAIGAWAVSRRR